MPDVNDVLSRIKKYLPKFIVWTADLESVIRTIGSKIVDIISALQNFSTYRYTGRGLLLTADELGVIRTGLETEEEIRGRVLQHHEAAKRRGTLDGIKNDIAQFLYINPSDVIITRFGPDNCGEIIDRTYEGIDDYADTEDRNRVIKAVINRTVPINTVDIEKIRQRAIPLGYIFELTISGVDSDPALDRARRPDENYILLVRQGDGTILTIWTTTLYDYNYVTLSDGTQGLITNG